MEEINVNKEPIYIMSIELETGITDKIIIYKDSKPEELAYYFCHRNNLDFTGLKMITEKINLLKKLKTLTSNKHLKIETYKRTENNKNLTPNKNNNKNIRYKNNHLSSNKNYFEDFSIKDTIINDNKNNNTCNCHLSKVSNKNFVIEQEKYLNSFLEQNEKMKKEKLYNYLYQNNHKNILNYDLFFNQFKKKLISKNKKFAQNLKKVNQINKSNPKFRKININSNYNLRTYVKKNNKTKNNNSFLITIDKKIKNYINIYTFNKSFEKRSKSGIKNNSFKIRDCNYNGYNNKNNSIGIKNYYNCGNYNEVTPIKTNKINNYLINISNNITLMDNTRKYYSNSSKKSGSNNNKYLNSLC